MKRCGKEGVRGGKRIDVKMLKEDKKYGDWDRRR